MSRFARPTIAACVSLGALVGCSSAGSKAAPTVECSGMGRSGVVNGANDETYLGLAPAQIRAIVQVVDAALWSADASIPAGGLCSGTFIAPAWVVTAAHCLQIQDPAVVVQTGAGMAPIVLAVTAIAASPDEDVALVEVGAAPGDAAAADASSGDASTDASIDEGDTAPFTGVGVSPIAAGGASIGQLAVGDVVELAGYGLTEASTAGNLRFAVEPIVAVDAASITVSGSGENGACDGDSGGPILVRGPDGAPHIAGVLAIGSSNCVGEDQYERLDAIQDWITSTIGAAPASDLECGAIDTAGRCLFGSALWCSGTQLSSDVCTGGRQCGWSAAEQGFRCVDSAVDPCGGVDSVGACQDGAAAACSNGALVRQTCAPCGSCRVNGRTGSPECVAEPADD
jgi:hypothetical protein